MEWVISGDVAARTGTILSQFVTAVKARLGELGVTTDPAVEHSGQTCEPEGVPLRSAQ
jgi:hypothetical protein